MDPATNTTSVLSITFEKKDDKWEVTNTQDAYFAVTCKTVNDGKVTVTKDRLTTGDKLNLNESHIIEYMITVTNATKENWTGSLSGGIFESSEENATVTNRTVRLAQICVDNKGHRITLNGNATNNFTVLAGGTVTLYVSYIAEDSDVGKTLWNKVTSTTPNEKVEIVNNDPGIEIVNKKDPQIVVKKTNDKLKPTNDGTLKANYTVEITNNSGYSLYGLRLTDVMAQPTLTKLNEDDEGTPSVDLTFSNWKVGTADAKITSTSEDGLTHVLQLIDRGTAFEDGQKVTLTYTVEVANANDEVAVKVKLDNTAKGASWSQAPKATRMFRMAARNIDNDPPDITGSGSSSTDKENDEPDVEDSSTSSTEGGGSSTTEGTLPRKYKVTYNWTGLEDLVAKLPDGTEAKLPEEKKYLKGAEVTKDKTYTKGMEVTVGEGENAKTYVFSGWDKSEDTFTMPENNVVITGKWTPNNPGIKVTKSVVEPDGKTNVKRGDTVKFEIKVENTGDVELKNIEVKDTLPAGLTAAENSETEWTIETLAPEASRTLVVSATVDMTAVGELKNKAEAVVDDPDVKGEGEASVTVEKSALASINKEVVEDSIPESVKIGQDVTLTYKITITGDKGANYVVSDDGAALEAGSSWTGILDESGTKDIYVTKTVTVTPDNVENGVLTISNTAFVKPDPDDKGTDPIEPDPNKPDTEDGHPSDPVETPIDVEPITITWLRNYLTGDEDVITTTENVPAGTKEVDRELYPYPANPTRPGYTFTEWGKPDVDPKTGNITIRAQWNPNDPGPGPGPGPVGPTGPTGGTDDGSDTDSDSDPDPDPTPATINVPDAPTPLAEIGETPVPLASNPSDLIDIFDDDVPLAGGAQTGNNDALWYLLAALSLAGLGIVKLLEKKNTTK